MYIYMVTHLVIRLFVGQTLAAFNVASLFACSIQYNLHLYRARYLFVYMRKVILLLFIYLLYLLIIKAFLYTFKRIVREDFLSFWLNCTILIVHFFEISLLAISRSR